MDKKLSQLIDAVAVLVPFREDALALVVAAGIPPMAINFNGAPFTMWFNIVSYAKGNEQVDALVDSLLQKFPRNPHLQAYREAILQDYSLGPSIKTDVAWDSKMSAGALQKITGKKSSLLPIRFLEIGLACARSVARVSITFPGRVELGSGFLLENNIFVTNNHVIPDPDIAAKATIEFRFEESTRANPIVPVPFHLAPQKGFMTCREADWTAVCLDGDANKDFSFLELYDTDLAPGDFVNIIQHPAGRYKEVGLYHNIVVNADKNIVQYLTDTEAGSSGSPVFNSDWKVVALHQSGGVLVDPALPNALRNQGIHISRVITGVTDLHKGLVADR
jgi:hypothetical protein